MTQVPPTYYASVAVRGPWWTDEEPSLRVPRTSGGAPAAIWTAGRGPSVLLVAPDAGLHDLWSPLSPLLRDRVTVHALDRSGLSHTDDVEQVTVAAEAVGAEYLAGFADDLALLREVGRRAAPVRSVAVLVEPGEAVAEELRAPAFMRRVEVSSRVVAELTEADARRLVDVLTEGGER
ncbi:hypothetical protein SAMN05216207_104135 [Pseudonocardia ammonioxydans]|uniref:Uncharacterized protein n=1 Tax=Pseudonocardia ammonioxydans TaxID=260086 RepID=A0A1I5FXC6_PSUAM|nr:hypothetical protein [Pseudonocardia ammonioxydans]SFO28395.1 hypothetical protein SAMN05216207_104135 [Pseudonocardia ammonioxydans]